MKITRGLPSISPAPHPVLTIGNFDGQHLGHRALVSAVVEHARQVRGYPMVLSFEPHPIEVLHPETVPEYLSEPQEKAAFFQDLGIGEFVVLPFNKELASFTPRQFIDGVLRDGLGVRDLFVGNHFVFGKGRSGSVQDLIQLGKQAKMSVHPMKPMTLYGQILSSTRIRQCLALGNVVEGTQCLGRPYQIRGTVVMGEKRGEPMGWPTANVPIPPHRVLPGDGIYATRTKVQGKWLDSISYIGKRPTFSGKERVLEVHIFDHSLELYGEELTIQFIERVREDMTFTTIEELIQQMNQDGRQAKALLKKSHEEIHMAKLEEIRQGSA